MSPYVINANSIKQAKYKTVDLVSSKGKRRKDQRGEYTLYVRNLVITIPCEYCELSDDPITARQQIDFGLGMTNEDVAKERGMGFIYAYGWEAREDNALEKAYLELQKDETTRRAYVPLFKSKHAGQEDIPCFVGLDFDIEDGKLNLTAFSRSNDVVIAMQSDIYGFTRLQMGMAERLGVDVGDYTQHVVNAHIRVSDMDTVKKILKEGY